MFAPFCSILHHFFPHLSTVDTLELGDFDRSSGRDHPVLAVFRNGHGGGYTCPGSARAVVPEGGDSVIREGH